MDTSILHNGLITRLRNAGVVEACNARRMFFYLTPPMINERSNSLFKGPLHRDARGSIRFLIDLRWAGFFNQLGGPKGIISGELENQNQPHLFYGDDFVKKARNNLSYFLNRVQLKEQDRSFLRKDFNKKENQKEKLKCLLNRTRKEKSKDTMNNNFGSFKNENFEKFSIKSIECMAESKLQESEFVKNWRSDVHKSPFFNKWVESKLFVKWYYMNSGRNKKVDKNALSDSEHLLYLLHTDGIVSHEQGFMRSACELLFSDKDYLSVDEFIKKIP